MCPATTNIDLTYCPPGRWSNQAPAKWRLLAPRVEELEDGLHWFVEFMDVPAYQVLVDGDTMYVKR